MAPKKTGKEKKKLLKPMHPDKLGKPTLVLGLENTLCYTGASQKRKERAIIPRPGTDFFLKELSPFFEIVLFTNLDKRHATQAFKKVCTGFVREDMLLCRGACHRIEDEKTMEVKYVKELSRLGRNAHNVIAVDNEPDSVLEAQEESALPLKPFTAVNKDDLELFDLAEFLTEVARSNVSVPHAVSEYVETCEEMREFVSKGGQLQAE